MQEIYVNCCVGCLLLVTQVDFCMVQSVLVFCDQNGVLVLLDIASVELCWESDREICGGKLVYGDQREVEFWNQKDI